jgi:hypothetical protein
MQHRILLFVVSSISVAAGACGPSALDDMKSPSVCAQACPTCEAVAPVRGAATGLAVDSNNLYWTRFDPSGAIRSGTVMIAPIAGGPIAELASALAHPTGLTADGTHVYWGDAQDGTILSVPISGGAPETIATGQSIIGGPLVSGNLLFWSTSTSVREAPVGGGTTESLGTGSNLRGLAVDATSAYWTDAGEGGDGVVMKAAIGGGTPQTIASGLSAPMAVAVDTTSVYWIDITDDAVVSASIEGGDPITLVRGAGVDATSSLAVDSSRLYWTTGSAGDECGAVMDAPLQGGKGTPLAPAQLAPANLVVNRLGAFWTNSSGVDAAAGNVMTLRRE